METIEKNNNNGEFYFKLISGSLFIISWIVLATIKSSSDISLVVPFWISIILTVIFIFSIFFKKIHNLTNRLKEKEKERQPIDSDKLKIILEEQVYKMWNYIEPGVPVKKKTENINNSIIYECHIKLYREIEFNGDLSNEIIILVNATYPELQPTILPENCSILELENAKNVISKCPLNPRIEKTKTTISPFGEKIQESEKIDYSKEKENEEEVV